jgi:RimJ/RimL family protein N-acetyltransferase
VSFQIETGRLILRDVREADLATLLAQSREPEAQRGILAFQANELYNRNYLEKAISEARFSRREHYALSVILKSGGDLIGTCNASGVRRDSIETNIGWHYGSRYWGRGFATEAARALLYIGFEIGGVKEIFADCFADNVASIRVMEKIGMTTRPVLNLFNKIRGVSYGEQRAAVRYVITRDEWLSNEKRKTENGKY